MDAPRPLGDTQDEIVVLTAVETLAKAPDVGDDRAPQHGQVGAVVLRP